MRELKSKVQGINDEKEQMTVETQDLTKKKAKLELNIKDIQDELEGDQSARVGIVKEIKSKNDFTLARYLIQVKFFLDFNTQQLDNKYNVVYILLAK